MSRNHPNSRATTRRFQDRQLEAQLEKYARLIQAGHVITSELNFDALFDVISSQIGKILNVERCSIFLIDENEQNLCPFVAADLESSQFQLSKDQGIAGWVFCNKVPQVVNAAYEDPRFCREVDKKTGFRTINILCVPLVSHRRTCIGTMQVLNKKEGDFTDEDVDILTYIASYVTIALENSFLYEELRSTDRARMKAVNHLAHELKTPLSILSVVMSRFAHAAHDYDLSHLIKTIDRGQRCITRLVNIQEKVEDIVGRKVIDCEKQYIHIFEDLISLLEEIDADSEAQCRKLAKQVIDRIKSMFWYEKEKIEIIRVDLFLNSICNHSATFIRDRNLKFSVEIEDNLFVKMDKNILRQTCEGLLKNAIENTPDEGHIELRAGSTGNEILLVIIDYGVGITTENQKNLFQGFFHTQSTQHYSSKTPYSFNAGGTGTDLLRMQTYSERFGFKMDFSSQRCRFLPREADVCPGRVSLCANAHTEGDCMHSGGSTFTVKFPKIGSSPPQAV